MVAPASGGDWLRTYTHSNCSLQTRHWHWRFDLRSVGVNSPVAIPAHCLWAVRITRIYEVFPLPCPLYRVLPTSIIDKVPPIDSPERHYSREYRETVECLELSIRLVDEGQR